MSEQPTANSIDGSVSISEQPTANSIVQVLVTNQSALAAIPEAILSANKPVLTEQDAPENTSQAVAEPSTNKLTEMSVDQMVQGTKACFIRRISVASNAIQTMDNEVNHLIYCLNCIRRD